MHASVPVSPVGPVAAATMVFRENGQLRVAAIVKASFAFTHHAPMRIAPPEPIFTKEAHRMNNPTRSIVATSDLVPRLPGADVLLLGQAHAPGGGAMRIAVRLAVGRGEETLLDKRVHVFGDHKGADIKPFATMPLVYEKAYGGPGYRENPIGTGVLGGDAPPNIVDPHAPDRAVGFAPISKTWPARSQLAPPDVRAALERPIAEIPPGFDFRYFHAAPADQRLGQIVGDEWILLEGVHPEHLHLHLQLPGAMAMVRVVGTESDGRVFSLRADTLRIDTEAERCTVVWRNSFPVREADLATVRLLAGVALPDVPIAWPLSVEGLAQASQAHDHAHAQRLAAADRMAAHHAAGGTIVIEETPLASTFSGTMEIADDDLEAVEDDAPDFSSTTVLGSTAVPPTQPLPSFLRGAPPPPAAPASFGTTSGHAHETPMHGHGHFPEHAPPAAPAIRPAPRAGERTLDLSSLPVPRDSEPPRARPRPRNPIEGTMDLTNNPAVLARAILPFAGGAPPPSSEPARVTGPIPGAPWAPEEEAPVSFEEAATADGPDLSSTMTSSHGHSAPPAFVAPQSVPVEPPAFVAPPNVPVEPPAFAAPPNVPEGATATEAASPDVPAPAAEAAPAAASAAAPAAAQAPPEPPNRESAVPAAPSDPWGRDLGSLPPAASPPSKPEPARPADSAPGLRSTLYKRFKK